MEQNESGNHLYSTSGEEIDLRSLLGKYLVFWPWIIGSLILSLNVAFIYFRYATNIYETSAKIKILDKNQGVELPSAETLFSKSNINLENEIESLYSYPILEKVVKKLNLCYNFYNKGHIKTSRGFSTPFLMEVTQPIDSIKKEILYEIEFDENGLKIYSEEGDDYLFTNYSTYQKPHNLPFEISWSDHSRFKEKTESYEIKVVPKKTTINQLKEDLNIKSVGKDSEIISIGLKSQNTDYSEHVINKIISVFNDDGVDDRRRVDKRTIDFINDRLIFLGQELDSIELEKQSFKLKHNLISVDQDASISMNLRVESDEEVFRRKNQLNLLNMLHESIKSHDYGLLPTNIGLNNSVITKLITQYNQNFFNRENLIFSGGENNPSIKLLTKKNADLKKNITISVEAFQNELAQSLRTINSQNENYNSQVSSIPEKEKVFRSIERSQEIQESLYLYLLQKREEAEVNYAVTEPSFKVLEYAISGEDPISPNMPIILSGFLLMGIFIPIGIIYLLFLFDDKIHHKKHLETLIPGCSLLGEIPLIPDEKDQVFSNPNQRSVLSEASRIISSNTNFLLSDKKTGIGSVIMATSSIKGEGKTFVALNLSLALASLNKKVLLIGADLRNPQIHKYVNEEKNKEGLTNYLHKPGHEWKKAILKPFKNMPSHHILIAGALPPNPVELLTNGRLDLLLEEAKSQYDYIVLDCAPTLLVTDTLLISHLADATVYLTRANHTKKEILEYPKKLIQDKKIKNVGFVLNGLGSGQGYGYHYSYGYKYGYNYGYGYGYNSES